METSTFLTRTRTTTVLEPGAWRRQARGCSVTRAGSRVASLVRPSTHRPNEPAGESFLPSSSSSSPPCFPSLPFPKRLLYLAGPHIHDSLVTLASDLPATGSPAPSGVDSPRRPFSCTIGSILSVRPGQRPCGMAPLTVYRHALPRGREKKSLVGSFPTFAFSRIRSGHGCRSIPIASCAPGGAVSITVSPPPPGGLPLGSSGRPDSLRCFLVCLVGPAHLFGRGVLLFRWAYQPLQPTEGYLPYLDSPLFLAGRTVSHGFWGAGPFNVGPGLSQYVGHNPHCPLCCSGSFRSPNSFPSAPPLGPSHSVSMAATQRGDFVGTLGLYLIRGSASWHETGPTLGSVLVR